MSTKTNNRQLIVDNRHNFVVGESYTYNDICKMCDMKKSSGEARQNQMNTFKSLFDVEEYKKGRTTFYKIVSMNELSEQSLVDLTLDKRGSNGVFTDDLQIVMLSILSQKRNGEIAFSKGKLFKELHLINDNYQTAKYNVPTLSKLIEVDESICYEFFNDSQRKMISYVETALDKLKSRRLIIWEKVLMVAKIDTVKNELGETKIVNFKEGETSSKVSVGTLHRAANTLEKKYILATEQEVMHSLGCTDTKEIFLKGKWNEFKRKVNQILVDKINVKYSYDGYLITYNHDRIEQALADKQTVTFAKCNINCNMVDSMRKNAETRQNNALEKQAKINSYEQELELYTVEELKAKGCTVKELSNRDEISLNETFVEGSITLANNVINTSAKDIRTNLHKRQNNQRSK